MKKLYKPLLACCLLAAILFAGSLTAYGEASSKGSASITIYDDRTTSPEPETDRPGSIAPERDGDTIQEHRVPQLSGSDIVSILNPETAVPKLGDLPKTGSDPLG